jgi:hypothetical protein
VLALAEQTNAALNERIGAFETALAAQAGPIVLQKRAAKGA